MAGSPRSVELSVRVYEVLIRAYPASFRHEYGGEMALVLREHLTDVRRKRGAAGLVAAWIRVLGDLARTASQEHLYEMQRKIAMRSATLAILAAALAAAGYLAAFAVITYMFVWIPVMAMFAAGMEFGGTAVAMGAFLYPAAFLSGLILGRMKPLFTPVITAQYGAVAIVVIWLSLVVTKEVWDHGGGIAWGQGLVNLLLFASLVLSAMLGRLVAIKASNRLARLGVPWFQVAGAMAVVIGSLAIACVLRLTQLAYRLAADQANPDLHRIWTICQFALLGLSAMATAQLIHLFVRSYRESDLAAIHRHGGAPGSPGAGDLPAR
jgi:hypothetical protein